MARTNRFTAILMTSAAALTLAACDGANSVASPGAGSVIINPPAPPPPPPPAPTPPPAITAAQFASSAGGTAAITFTVDEQLALISAAPSSNNNPNGTRVFAAVTSPFIAAPTVSPLTTTPTATDPLTLNTGGSTFLQAGSFLGAFSGPNDTNFQQWTCDSSSANFNTTPRLCTTPPIVVASGATPAATACPTGTTDGGTFQNVRLCRLPNAITTDLNLPLITGVAYLLDGLVQVGVDVGTTGAPSNTTLTIAPGVVVVANPLDAANDVLIVNRGAQIQAVGTAAQPIIFTGRQNLQANAVSETTQGLWGGIILAGQAPLADCAQGGPNDAAGSSTTCQARVEGLAAGTLISYGGPNAASNSGRFQFVQIRYTGIDISAGGGNELQGLTTAGVGNATQIDHVQSHNSADDGIEIFGGTHNLRYAAITGADDDGFDYDFGWRGFVQFLVVAQRPGGATNDSFTLEVDTNNNEDLLPRTFGQIVNFTFIHTASSPAAIRIRGGADTRLVNGYLQSAVPCLNIVAQQVNQTDRSTYRAADPARQDVGPPIFNSIYFACSNR